MIDSPLISLKSRACGDCTLAVHGSGALLLVRFGASTRNETVV
jgi:hypothetical protein